jgi:NAD(P)-dependent dehydrogenase (short-subunit alcohol dehydrogenase family)
MVEVWECDVNDYGMQMWANADAGLRGIIDTEMHRESVRIRGKEGDYKIQIPRKGQPEEVAALISWLMCDGSQYITGTTQIIDGGIMA